MTSAIKWSEHDRAVEGLVKFLKIVTQREQLKDWHVIFSMGTVVRVFPDEINEFAGYDSEYIANYPTDRLTENLDSIMQENTQIWEKQKNYSPILRTAYQMLIDDGYPYPGSDKSDRLPLPLENIDESHISTDEITRQRTWMIIWMNASDFITNLSWSNSPFEAVATGGELRRLDYIFPRVQTIISPNLEIITI